ncbi:MAG: response regulator [Candidatus Sigynarchaeota archaeon]
MPDLLIVDDDVDCLEFLSRVLRARFPSLSIDTARDGTSALQKIENAEPSLVLTDLQMPGIDGLELSARLKARPGSSVKVVLMTSKNANLISLGHVDKILYKPFSLEALYKQVARYSKLEGNNGN